MQRMPLHSCLQDDYLEVTEGSVNREEIQAPRCLGVLAPGQRSRVCLGHFHCKQISQLLNHPGKEYGKECAYLQT